MRWEPRGDLCSLFLCVGRRGQSGPPLMVNQRLLQPLQDQRGGSFQRLVKEAMPHSKTYEYRFWGVGDEWLWGFREEGALFWLNKCCHCQPWASPSGRQGDIRTAPRAAALWFTHISALERPSRALGSSPCFAANLSEGPLDKSPSVNSV